jgi:hypothetical protein
MAKVTVMLALAAGPGFPEGSPEHRYEIELVLDATGRPDAAAWAADPEPWRARRIRPGAEPLRGDVQHDPDHGWSIRFFEGAADSPDALRLRPRPGAPGRACDGDGAGRDGLRLPGRGHRLIGGGLARGAGGCRPGAPGRRQDQAARGAFAR